NNVTVGGKVWVLDHFGQTLPGWPASLPAKATTPPAFAGIYPNASVFVGCADGRVYQIGLDGQVRGSNQSPLAAAISGWLAIDAAPLGGGGPYVAAGDASGYAAVYDFSSVPAHEVANGWPIKLGQDGFKPDFLWIDFDGNGHPASGSPTC